MSDDEREERELDLTSPEVVTKYKSAAEIVNKALQLVLSECKPSAKIVDLCEKGDTFIREQTGNMYKNVKKKIERVGEFQVYTMGTKEEPPPRPPKLVKLNHAFKLAEKWVSTMSECPEDEAGEMEMEIESRPLGLGLGAKAPPKTQFRPSNDPVERKLQKKLHFGRKKAAGDKGSVPSAKNEIDEDSDDENMDSRTNAFLAKKRSAPQSVMAQAKKKPK